MKTTLITSALFASMAMAGYNAQKYVQSGLSGGSAKFLQARETWTVSAPKIVPKRELRAS
jgi:hypothetical protein